MKGDVSAGDMDEKEKDLDGVGTTVDRDDKLDLEGVPVDRGWAWILLSGCVLYSGLYGGTMRSFGVFFLQYQERFNAKAAEVAIMGVIENVVNSVVGLVVMIIGLKRLSCRTIVATGAAFISLSYIVTSFVEDIRLFYITLGLFAGTGISMVRLPTLSIIGIYFDKHRGLATSLYSGAASIGGLILAPIVTTLFDRYGFSGTMLIVGGLFLNIFVTASVMRPPAWFKRRHRKIIDSEVTEKLLFDQTIETHDDVSNCASSNGPEDYKVFNQKTVDYSSASEKTEAKTDESKGTCCRFVKINFIDALIAAFDVKLLKDLLFLLYLAMAFNLVAGMILVFIFLPPFAKDNGLSYDQIARMISAMACADFISKIVGGFIADRKWLQRSTLLAIAALATGSLCHLARFYTSYPSVMIMPVIMACFFGWYPAMYTPVLIDCVGLEKLNSSLGFVSVIHGISMGTFFPVTGILRDTSGSYINSLHLAGGLCYIGGVLLIMMSVIQNMRKNTEKLKSVGDLTPT